MAYNTFIPIVTDGLAFSVDAYNKKSYVSGEITTYDLTSNGNNGTLVNGVGFDDNTWTFDGVNDYIDLGTNGMLDGILNWSVDVWFKVNAYHDGTIFVERDLTSTAGISALIRTTSAGKILMAIRSEDGAQQTVFQTDNYVTGEWINATFTRDVNNVESYINGVSTNTASLPYGTISMTSNNSLIGKQFVTSSDLHVFNGDISNIRIYNKTTSSEEVKQNYNATKWRFK